LPKAALGRGGGKAAGVLRVRGPWIIANFFKGEGGNPLAYFGDEGRFPSGDVSTIDADGYMQIADRSKAVPNDCRIQDRMVNRN
jgi:3-(methylthio)propionyl---CoA ligase